MADNDERSTEDLSDEPSQYKMEEMRRKGQVSQSRELSGLMALLAAGTALYVISPQMSTQLLEYMKDAFRTDLAAQLNLSQEDVLTATFMKGLKLLLFLVAPVIVAAGLLGALGSFAQIGSIFSVEPIRPDLQKIDPVKGMMKFFSMKQVYDGLRLIFRACVVIIVAYFLVKYSVMESGSASLVDPRGIGYILGDHARVIFYSLCGVLFIFAVFDFWIQKWEFWKNAKVTKREAKEEYKEREGDPLIKARIRAVQREMSRKRMMQDVKTADVVITNPTHIAIALRYDREAASAPKVVAMGADFIAQKIKKIAADAGVPLVENKPLARTLFKTVKLGQVIPRALYQAVAEVLAYVYKLKGKKI